jgi:8-oxo-dGTP pyrophosphatase MutT (NUDIX family)
VAIAAHDSEHLWLVRQPREAVGEPRLLELPAGKLDVEGESRLECARRELIEEIGKSAGEWRELKRFYTTPGFAEEEVTVFEATDLADVEHEPDPAERIEIVPWPLVELDTAIAECADSKSLIGMLLLRDTLAR